MVEYFASTVTLEVLWQALFNSATHVHEGAVVSLQWPFLSSLIEIHIDLSKYYRCPIIFFLFQISYSFF